MFDAEWKAKLSDEQYYILRKKELKNLLVGNLYLQMLKLLTIVLVVEKLCLPTT